MFPSWVLETSKGNIDYPQLKKLAQKRAKKVDKNESLPIKNRMQEKRTNLIRKVWYRIKMCQPRTNVLCGQLSALRKPNYKPVLWLSESKLPHHLLRKSPSLASLHVTTEKPKLASCVATFSWWKWLGPKLTEQTVPLATVTCRSPLTLLTQQSAATPSLPWDQITGICSCFYNRSTTPLGLSGMDWGGKPPPWLGTKDRERSQILPTQPTLVPWWIWHLMAK